MKEGYEGIAVSVSILVIVFAAIALSKWLF